MSDRTALYWLHAADGALLYVGITNNLERRWTQHAQDKEWWPLVMRQTAEWYETREAAAAAERVVIESEHPLHNTTYAAAPPPAPARYGNGRSRQFRELCETDPILGDVAITGLRYSRMDLKKINADHIAAVVGALRAGHRPTDVASWSPFSAAYLRRLARDAGIPPATKGHSPSP